MHPRHAAMERENPMLWEDWSWELSGRTHRESPAPPAPLCNVRRMIEARVRTQAVPASALHRAGAELFRHWDRTVRAIRTAVAQTPCGQLTSARDSLLVACLRPFRMSGLRLRFRTRPCDGAKCCSKSTSRRARIAPCSSCVRGSHGINGCKTAPSALRLMRGMSWLSSRCEACGSAICTAKAQACR